MTGGSVNPCQKSASTLSFSKLNFDSILDLREADSDPESQLMTELIRQEEGRGGRRIKKLTHRMKNLTNSSRSIFNDKYSLLMRKIDEHSRSSSSGSRSLGSVIYFPTKNVTIRSESNSMLDVRKPKKWLSSEPKSCIKTLKRTTHPIVRSVSDDSAMKQPSPSLDGLVHSNKVHPSSERVGSETSTSTPSSPNICSTCDLHQSLEMLSSYLELHSIDATSENISKMEEDFEDTKTDIVEFFKDNNQTIDWDSKQVGITRQE